MKPDIDGTSFGSIVIDGKTYKHDVVIRRNGRVEKRKKHLSREVYGNSHTVALAEAKDLLESGVTEVVIGTGQNGVLTVSDEVLDYLEDREIDVVELATPEAIEMWNAMDEDVVGLFHVTC